MAVFPIVSFGASMTHVLDFSSSELVPPLSKCPFNRVDSDKEIVRLRGSALFTGLSSQQYREILMCAGNKTFARDEVLFSQGEIVDMWILIQTGRVKLTQLSFDGSEVIVWMNNSGDAIGVQADTPGGRHTCFARAMERCQTLVWEHRGIQAVLARCPQVKANITGILSARLCELEERFCEIASESVADRLALLLQRLCKSVGRQNGCGIEIRLRRQDLAQMTGTTLCTVSRILSRWADLGFVIPNREAITVRDPDHLVANPYRPERTAPVCRQA
jgi:CRP-like cAMP-binding protein